MIITKRIEKNNITDFSKFGDAMPDGRLTGQSNGTIYRLREAIMYSKSLGRELTPDEMKKFVIAV